MKKFALYTNDKNAFLDPLLGFKETKEENIFLDKSSNDETLFYQDNDNKNLIYSVTKNKGEEIKQSHSIKYLNSLKENNNLLKMKKIIYKRGDLDLIVSYEHPLLINPIFFYVVDDLNSEYLCKVFSKFLNISEEIKDIDSFSEYKILKMSDETIMKIFHLYFMKK